MARVLWLCRLVQSSREGAWQPRVVEVLDSIGPHMTRWSTTPGNRPIPYAVGASNVDATQLAALQEDNTIHLFDEGTRNTQFDQLPGAVRTRINQFCSNIGVAQPSNNETLRDLCQRIVQIIDGKNIEDHLSEV